MGFVILLGEGQIRRSCYYVQQYCFFYFYENFQESCSQRRVHSSALGHPQNQPQVNRQSFSNIIQVTEEQQSNPQSEEYPKQSTTQQTPKLSKISSIKSRFRCICNWWRFLCPSPSRIELDVNDTDFTEVVSKLRNKKSYYAPILPVQKQIKKVLVLDLDETLIHTSFSKPEKYDYQSEVMFNGKPTKIYTVKRFGLEAFLFQMSKLFEIVVFTASQKLYADKVLDLIDPKHRISYRLYREHCVVINKTYYLKNLKILGRDLTQTIIVDDNNIAGLLHPDNFYRIQQFDGNLKDRQLCRLSAFLKHIHGKSEILPVSDLRKKFEEMEINLEEAVLEPDREGRSLDARMRQYKHKKTNSEVQSLFKDEEGEAQTTASQIVKSM